MSSTMANRVLRLERAAGGDCAACAGLDYWVVIDLGIPEIDQPLPPRNCSSCRRPRPFTTIKRVLRGVERSAT